MFANTKSKSSLFRIAVLSLLAAGCTSRKVKVEEIFIDEVLVTMGQGKTTFSLDSKKGNTVRELIKSIDMAREAEGDDGHKYHIVVYVYNTTSGNKVTNRRVANQRAHEAVKTLHGLGYDGQVSFVFSVADTPGLKFSVSSAGMGLPLPEALEKAFGPEHKEHKGKVGSKSKSQPKSKAELIKASEDDDEDDLDTDRKAA